MSDPRDPSLAEDETEVLELFNQNDAARNAVRHAHHLAEVTQHG